MPLATDRPVMLAQDRPVMLAKDVRKARQQPAAPKPKLRNLAIVGRVLAWGVRDKKYGATFSRETLRYSPPFVQPKLLWGHTGAPNHKVIAAELELFDGESGLLFRALMDGDEYQIGKLAGQQRKTFAVSSEILPWEEIRQVADAALLTRFIPDGQPISILSAVTLGDHETRQAMPGSYAVMVRPEEAIGIMRMIDETSSVDQPTPRAIYASYAQDDRDDDDRDGESPLAVIARAVLAELRTSAPLIARDVRDMLLARDSEVAQIDQTGRTIAKLLDRIAAIEEQPGADGQVAALAGVLTTALEHQRTMAESQIALTDAVAMLARGSGSGSAPAPSADEIAKAFAGALPPRPTSAKKTGDRWEFSYG